MPSEFDDLAKDVVAAPLGEVIAAVGEGVAHAQAMLDAGSLAKTLEIYRTGGEAALELLRDIGYRPTFYALPETTGEVRVSLTLGNAAQSAGAASRALPASGVGATSRLVGAKRTTVRSYVSPVSAGFANRYAYSADISAKITFKIVPVPAPDGADELRVMPALEGTPAAAAVRALESLGLEVRLRNASGTPLDTVSETSTVERQSLAPESILRAGDAVVLTIAP